MTCKRFDARKATQWSAAEFAEHVRECADCAALADLDNRLNSELLKLREPIAAPGLWDRIESALAEEKVQASAGREPRPAGRRIIGAALARRWQVLVPVGAAVLIILVTALLLLLKGPAAPSGILARESLAKVEQKEKEYADAIEALEKLARPKIDAMDLHMASLYRDKLATIDAQLEKCREALESNPANAHIRRYLLAALEDKHQTLAELAGSLKTTKKGRSDS